MLSQERLVQIGEVFFAHLELGSDPADFHEALKRNGITKAEFRKFARVTRRVLKEQRRIVREIVAGRNRQV